MRTPGGKTPPLLFSVLFLASLASASAQFQPRGYGGSTPAPAVTAPKDQGAPANFSASATVGQTNSMDVLNDTIKLSAGDILSYRVVEDGREPISLRIGDSGDV